MSRHVPKKQKEAIGVESVYTDFKAVIEQGGRKGIVKIAMYVATSFQG